MEYNSEYELKLLEIIKEYSQEEYDSLVNAPQVITTDHLEVLAEQYPTEEKFRKEYCEQRLWEEE